MPNTFPCRFIISSLLFTVLLSVTTSLEAARLTKNRHFFRLSASDQSGITLPQEDAQQQLTALAAELKKDYRKITDADLQRSKKLLLQEVDSLIRALSKEPAGVSDGKTPIFARRRRVVNQEANETADEWKSALKLAELKAALESDTLTETLADEIQNTLYSNKEGVRWTLFDALRSALRRYQNIDKLLKNKSYDKQLVNVLDNLPKYVSQYNAVSSPLYAEALAEVTGWLDDISLFEPRTATLASLTRSAVSGVNVRLQISEDFIKAGFAQSVSEIFDIDDDILGTKVVGSGTVSGDSTAELAQSNKAAAIKVLINADMRSDTKGSHPPVTLKTHTTGTLSGEKEVVFSAEAVTTKPAKTQANLKPEISDVRIDTCRLIKPFVRMQIDSQKNDSKAEAELKAAKRLSNRLDGQIDSRIAELNEQYQNIRQPLVKAGLFPKVWNLSSSEDAVDWSILLATRNQPSAPKQTPSSAACNGLTVQIHQSAINNLASTFLAGNFIDEEKSAQRIAKYFKNKPKFLERQSDVSPAKVSFGQKAPVDVSFAENKIKVVVRLEDIEVLNSNDKSYVITVEYKVSSSKKDGRDVVVLEQSVAEAYPSSYKQGGRLSAVQTIIRSYLMKRLENLPKRFEAQPLNLEGEWKDKGRLIPLLVSAENGWLTLAWNWQEK